MDALRKQLDVLMGANRNGDAQEVTRKYFDRDVCRLFLAGLCPHELFQLTKMDKGPCPKVHSLQLRKEYEEAKAKGLDNYDRDLEDNIDRLIIECDRKIARALKRLDEEDAKAAIAISVSEVTQTPEIIELSKQIKAKLKEADQADLEGKTDVKIRALEEVEELRTKRADKQSMLLDAFNKDRASLPQPLTNASQTPMPAAVPDPRIQEMINEKLKKAEDLGEQGTVDEAQKALEEAEALKKTDQKLRVCDICGAFLSVYDSDRRLADHFGGKLHLGYMQIREKLSELQSLLASITEAALALECFDLSSFVWYQEERDKKRKAYEEERRSRDRRSRDLDRESSKDRGRGDSHERGRDYDRRSRDRDRHLDRDRDYDRERERDRERSRSYDSRSHRRSRSRSRERSRDYDRYSFLSMLQCPLTTSALILSLEDDGYSEFRDVAPVVVDGSFEEDSSFAHNASSSIPLTELYLASGREKTFSGPFV
ncbi:UNVERIFIED_CONTAM: putative RNA-binding protein Luc7-like 1 [Sesamum radiatum]|uniref:RNA-binding protein Luc7-like 1 n=1 Tax=Sesamum radiatum TaxID=300843 RepID=A0AAW2TF96_SESRA